MRGLFFWTAIACWTYLGISTAVIARNAKKGNRLRFVGWSLACFGCAMLFAREQKVFGLTGGSFVFVPGVVIGVLFAGWMAHHHMQRWQARG